MADGNGHARSRPSPHTDALFNPQSRRLIAASPQGARRLNHGFDSDSDYESNNEWRHEAITDSGGKRKEKTPRELVIKSQSRRN
ncbi:Pre-mRNA-splicing factor SPP2 [Colletotrichum sp. SAR 10_99]|nr:Pre-mRNA-splicing factor SPP2 [Colletotrichum sp. SAR 10_99]